MPGASRISPAGAAAFRRAARTLLSHSVYSNLIRGLGRRSRRRRRVLLSAWARTSGPVTARPGWLPGGYPELPRPRGLAFHHRFLDGLRRFPKGRGPVLAHCGRAIYFVPWPGRWGLPKAEKRHAMGRSVAGFLSRRAVPRPDPSRLSPGHLAGAGHRLPPKGAGARGTLSGTNNHYAMIRGPNDGPGAHRNWPTGPKTIAAPPPGPCRQGGHVSGTFFNLICVGHGWTATPPGHQHLGPPTDRPGPQHTVKRLSDIQVMKPGEKPARSSKRGGAIISEPRSAKAVSAALSRSGNRAANRIRSTDRTAGASAD